MELPTIATSLHRKIISATTTKSSTAVAVRIAVVGDVVCIQKKEYEQDAASRIASHVLFSGGEFLNRYVTTVVRVRSCTRCTPNLAKNSTVVGDVVSSVNSSTPFLHDDWDPIMDAKALRHLKPDVVLFTGDIGNANVNLVREISKIEFPMAAILGNHDCWVTGSRFANIEQAEKGTREDPVQEQLNLLGDAHVGFSRSDFPDFYLSVVGGRPFSLGGKYFYPAFLGRRYGVHNFQESAELIKSRAKEAPQENALIFLAHNGPHGLGSKVEDICGRDWVQSGGDHGDPDLAVAISDLKKEGLQVPLVVFGHMHRDLKYGHPRRRTMLFVGPDGTVYLNAAVVPRVQKVVASDDRTLTQRHFALVNFQGREVKSIHEVWVTVGAEDVDCETKQILMYPWNASEL